MSGVAQGVQDPEHWRPLLGSRVVVRVRSSEPDGDRQRDLLGELIAVHATDLQVRTRRGIEGAALADVVAGKPVPPAAVRRGPPHRALSVAALEAVMAQHWRAPDTERLGGWLLRAADGFTNRANSVLPLGDPSLPAADAVSHVVTWYEKRGLPPRAALPQPAPDEPDRGALVAAGRAFEHSGWTAIPGAGADVLTAPTAALRSGEFLDLGSGVGRVVLLDEPDAAWLAAYHYRGQPLASIGPALLRSAPQQVFAAVRDGASTVAVARASVAAGWAGLTAVEVDERYRRRGLARAILAAAASWAWDRGSLSMYVQVGETNDAARALYLAAGFTRHHRYAYHRPAAS